MVDFRALLAQLVLADLIGQSSVGWVQTLSLHVNSRGNHATAGRAAGTRTGSPSGPLTFLSQQQGFIAQMDVLWLFLHWEARRKLIYSVGCSYKEFSRCTLAL